MKITLKNKHIFTTVTVAYQGMATDIANVLIDTDSATCILAIDAVTCIQIEPELEDIFRINHINHSSNNFQDLFQ